MKLTEAIIGLSILILLSALTVNWIFHYSVNKKIEDLFQIENALLQKTDSLYFALKKNDNFYTEFEDQIIITKKIRTKQVKWVFSIYKENGYLIKGEAFINGKKEEEVFRYADCEDVF